MTLLVNSNLKANANDSTGRAEPDVLLITHARRAPDGQEPGHAGLHAQRHEDTGRRPPESISGADDGVARADAGVRHRDPGQSGRSKPFPEIYAEKLTQFHDDSILLEVSLYGTTTGDIEVDFRPFLYPVAICEGCLSHCMKADGLMAKDVSALQANKCPDNAAQDNRVCVDPGC